MNGILSGINDLYEESGYEGAKEIIEKSIELLNDNDILRRFELVEEIDQKPEILNDYVDELNESLNNEVQEMVNEALEDIREYGELSEWYGYEIDEIKEEAWEKLEKQGSRLYTKDNITFKEVFDGPRPYWEVESDKICNGALGGYDVSEEVKDFTESYWKEISEKGTELIDRLDEIDRQNTMDLDLER